MLRVTEEEVCEPPQVSMPILCSGLLGLVFDFLTGVEY